MLKEMVWWPRSGNVAVEVEVVVVVQQRHIWQEVVYVVVVVGTPELWEGGGGGIAPKIEVEAEVG